MAVVEDAEHEPPVNEGRGWLCAQVHLSFISTTNDVWPSSDPAKGAGGNRTRVTTGFASRVVRVKIPA
jgi:hypothetical protein